MSPHVEISAATLSRLQKYAEPLVDNFDSVLNKVMDIADNKQGSPLPTANVKDFSGGKVPNLSFTTMLSAQVGGKVLPKSETKWNQLFYAVIVQAAAKLKDVKALKQLIIVNYVVGKKEDQGYRYLSKAGISVQGQDTPAAWKATSHILKAMHIPAEIVFVWQDNEKAAHPGQTGKLTVN